MTTGVPRPGRQTHGELTARQAEVLRLVARGRTNFQIAQELGLSLEGVKYHLREIMGRLGAASREEAAERWRGLRRDSWKGAVFLFAARPALFVAGAGVAALGAGLAVAAFLGLGGGGPAAEPLPADAASAPACTTSGSTVVPDTQSTFQWFTFVRLNSTMYLPVGPESAPPGLQGMALGPRIGAVRWDVNAPAIDPCHAELDGAAAGLAPGTPVYAVADYRPSFRVVIVTSGGERILFESVENAKATTGPDMMDIAGRVAAAEIRQIPWSEPDMVPAPIATITEGATLRELERLLEGAPVGLVYIDTLPAMAITLVLWDGSKVSGPFSPVEGFAHNLKVPPRFSQVIEQFVVFDPATGKLIAR